MRVLDRYIVGAISAHVALVMAVLLALVGLFLFINEQGWVGVGRYGNLQALRFVAFNLPAAVLQFLPVAAMIGSLLAMGSLARGSEITVMRAAGISMGRLCLSVTAAGLLLVPLALALGEWIAPPLSQEARITKAAERSGSSGPVQGGGIWIRDGQRIMRADSANATQGGGVSIFELGETDALLQVQRAAGVLALEDNSWELRDVATSRFIPGGVVAGNEAAQVLAAGAGAAFLDVVTGDPADLSMQTLARTIAHLQQNNQDARRYRFAYWSAVARLAAIPLAVLLAVPLLTGTLRTAEGGARMTLGLVLGLGYFMAQRMVESGTIAFALDPQLLAFLPTMLLAAIVVLLLVRQRMSANRRERFSAA